MKELPWFQLEEVYHLSKRMYTTSSSDINNTTKIKKQSLCQMLVDVHRVSSGIALPRLNHGTGWGWVVTTPLQPLYPQERDRIPTAQGLVWKGVEKRNFHSSTGVQTLDCIAQGDSLYQLCWWEAKKNNDNIWSMWQKILAEISTEYITNTSIATTSICWLQHIKYNIQNK